MARLRLARTGLLLLALCALGQPAAARIYQWVDEAGTPHYSDRAEDVPPEFRDQFENEAQGAPVDRVRDLEAMFRRPAGPEPSDDDAAGAAEAPALDPFDAQEMLDQLEGPVLVGAAVGFVFVLGLVVAFGALALLLACRVISHESPGFKKAYGITLVQIFAGMVAAPGLVVVMGRPDLSSVGDLVAMQAVQATLMLLVNAVVLRAMLCETTGRAVVLALVVNIVLLVLGIGLAVGIVTCAGGAALLSR
jgi:hypothetical protein